MTKAALWMVDADAVADADLLRFRDWLSAGELARYCLLYTSDAADE